MDYLNDEIRHFTTWLKANKLFINVEKVKMMIFKAKQKKKTKKKQKKKRQALSKLITQLLRKLNTSNF